MRGWARAAPWAVLLITSLLVTLREQGTSPLVQDSPYQDTLEDERLVQQCTRNDRCPLAGSYNTVPGLRHPAGFVHLRVLGASLGLSREQQHLGLALLDALAALLIAFTAARMGGGALGAIAGALLVLLLRRMIEPPGMLNDQRILPFAGACALASAIIACERGRLVELGLAAAAGAVLLSLHLSTLPWLGVLAALVVLAPRRAERRSFGLRGAVVALALVTAGLAISPEAWALVAQRLAAGAPPAAAGAHALPPLVLLGLATVAALLVRFMVDQRAAQPDLEARRGRLLLLIAVALPIFGYLVGQRATAIEEHPRYLLYAVGAIALGLAQLLGAGTAALARLVGARWAAAPGLLLLVGLAATRLPSTPAQLQLSFGDLDAVRSLLTERGWDREQLLAGLGGPLAPRLLHLLLPVWPSRDALPPLRSGDADRTALVFQARTASLPSPLPVGWQLARAGSTDALVVIFAPARLDWHHMRVCTPPGGACQATGLELAALTARTTTLRGMPPAGAPGAFTIAVPVRGSVETFLSLRMRGARCTGRVLTVPGGAARIAPDGASAHLLDTDGGSSGAEVVLAWSPGGPECDAAAYLGLPPPVLAVDEPTRRAIEALDLGERQ